MSGHIPSPPAHGAFTSFDESSVTHLHAAAVARKELCEHKVQTEKNHRLGNHLEAAIPQPVRESKHR
ncbi:hypothetical protein, partial [Mycobacterium sp.]|uniref:hypothetical protein n=1 Tax=Mycobacterium sp. TaxID=1785 RepID=UPI002C045354